MVRVYHLWLSTKVVAANAPAGIPITPVTPATLTTTNTNNVTWQVDWDNLFKGYNKKYRRCSVKFQLNSDSWTAAAGDWETYNGVLTCSLQSNTTGITTYSTPLGLYYAVDCPTTGTTTHAIVLNTLSNQQGVDVLVPTGNSYFTLSWYRSNLIALTGASIYDYQILLQFELSEPFDEKDC